MGDWEDFYLQNRCLANLDFHADASESCGYLQWLSVINREFTAYKIKQKWNNLSFLKKNCCRPRRKLRRSALLTAKSAEPTLGLFMQMAESVEWRYENIWQIFLLCTVFAGGSWRTWRSTASSRTLLLSLFQKIICIISVTMLFFFFCLLHHCRYKLINPEQEDAITSCCQFRSKIKGHFLVERSIDWTMKPKSGVQYSTVSGLWRKADPRIASYYITAKISFKGWKKKPAVCVSGCEMLLLTVAHLSFLLFLVSSCFGL